MLGSVRSVESISVSSRSRPVLAGAGWAGVRHAMKMAAAALGSTAQYAPPLLRNWLRSKTSGAAELVSCRAAELLPTALCKTGNN